MCESFSYDSTARPNHVHREQWEQLRADRSKITAAVEEVLRYEGPVQYDMRAATTDVHLHVTTIPAGSAVMLLGASANRDERAFTDADTFNINRDRGEAQNLGFGYGIHSCLGAALARLESAIALGHLLNPDPVETVPAHTEWSCQWPRNHLERTTIFAEYAATPGW